MTPGGFRESALVAGLSQDALNSMESKVRARMRLYRPGGQMACELAKNPTVLIVNDSVFAHGGVLAQHGELAHGLQDVNMLHWKSPLPISSAAAPFYLSGFWCYWLFLGLMTRSLRYMLLTMALISAALKPWWSCNRE